MRPSLDTYMMQLAEVASARTTCIKRAVGCVLTDHRGRVLAIAYNGVAAGVDHCNAGIVTSLLPSVPRSPSPEHWQSEAKFYLDRVKELWPDLVTGYAEPFGIKESTVKGEVGVLARLFPHTCTGHHLPSGQDSCEAVHAEQNAILQCHDTDKIATAYVTTSPCKPCLKLLLNTGCQRIVFDTEHTDPWPREQWLKAGRQWELFSKGGA